MSDGPRAQCLDLGAIRQRAAKAARGPWTHGLGDTEDGDDCEVIDSAEGSLAQMMCPADDVQANAQFIAHARTDIPLLLAEVDAAAQREARLLQLLRWAHTVMETGWIPPKTDFRYQEGWNDACQVYRDTDTFKQITQALKEAPDAR